MIYYYRTCDPSGHVEEQPYGAYTIFLHSGAEPFAEIYPAKKTRTPEQILLEEKIALKRFIGSY